MTAQATILVIDDTDTGRAHLRKTLEDSDLRVAIVQAADGAEGLKMAMDQEVDLVISDIVMPHMDGLAMLRNLRRHYSAEALPVILVTTEDDLNKRELSFGVGANDYIHRPFSAVELISRVSVQMRIRRLQRELQRSSELHRQKSVHDTASGLANRRHFFRLAEDELARSRRHGFPLAMVVIDIDGFRAHERWLGYVRTDELIAELGGLLVRSARTCDVLGRFGAGRFVALLPHTSTVNATRICERWWVAIAAARLPGLDQGALSVTFGAAHCPTEGVKTIDELFSAAERSVCVGANADTPTPSASSV